MRSYIEILYIDSDGQARKTDMEHVGASNAETWEEFRSLRRYAVDSETGRFLLDYHNGKGDLADTICIDIGGFVAITGSQPKTDAAYRAIDLQYWRNAQSATRNQTQDAVA